MAKELNLQDSIFKSGREKRRYLVTIYITNGFRFRDL